MPETFGIAWALAKWLGIPIIFLSYLSAWKVTILNVNFDELSVPYKNTMYFMSCVSIAVYIWERFYKGKKTKEEGAKIQEEIRKMKIENDQQEWRNKIERGSKSSN